MREKLRQAIADAERLDFSKVGQYTVGQWMDIWYENYATVKVRASSHQTYQGYIKHHIKPYIGDIPLNKLITLDLQRLYKRLLTSGRVDRLESRKQPKGLTANMVRNINQIISSALDQAIAQKLILTNPTKGCALPKIEHREMKTLSSDQLSAFLREAKESGVYELYYFELATGLRRGELVGLKWEDVDWHRHTIRIRRQVARVNGVISEVQLKTKSAYRTISLGEGAMRVLETQEKKSDSEYIFPSLSGGPMAPDSMLKMLHRVLQRAGLPMLRMHDLRHPYVKLTTKKYLLQKQKSQATVADNLGFLFLLYSKRSCTLYSISIRLSGYTRTPSIRRSASAVVRPVASASSFEMLLRWASFSFASCSRFA